MLTARIKQTKHDDTAAPDHLLVAHLEEAERHGATIFNLGSTSGDDSIHSKTDHGRLYTLVHEDGSISHEWSPEAEVGPEF